MELTKKCFFRCGIVIIIIFVLIIIAAGLTSYYMVKSFKNNFRDQYRISLAEHCQNLPTIHYRGTIKMEEPIGIYHYDLSKNLLGASLMVTQSNCRNIVPIPNPPGFTHQNRVYGINPEDQKNIMVCTIFDDFDSKESQGKFLMAFTGTFFLDEWYNDINFPQTEPVALDNYRPGVKVHQGFYNLYMTIRSKLWSIFNAHRHQIKEFYITGHSLGGSLSTLGAFDFAKYTPIFYSFASPRTGNDVFANTFDKLVPQSLRIYNIEDMIPNLPPPVIMGNTYKHIGKGVPFNVNLGSIAANHIQSYEDFLPKCFENIAPCHQ